jgi:hypothetical protein
VKRPVIAAASIGAMSTTALLLTPTQMPWWCLALTVAQACVHLACSRDHPLGWTLGLALQPPWATYSVLTNQPAFLITTTIITIANLLALERHTRLGRAPRSTAS